ncbi:MAG TPA: hypothetical protein VGH11_02235 [Jatrophihabitans sp.]|jgi:hypothetical protein
MTTSIGLVLVLIAALAVLGIAMRNGRRRKESDEGSEPPSHSSPN